MENFFSSPVEAVVRGCFGPCPDVSAAAAVLAVPGRPVELVFSVAASRAHAEGWLDFAGVGGMENWTVDYGVEQTEWR